MHYSPKTPTFVSDAFKLEVIGGGNGGPRMHSKAPISNASHSTFNTPLHTCIHPISVYIVTTAPKVTSDLLSKRHVTV